MYACQIEENVYVPQGYDPEAFTIRQRAAAACKTALMLEKMTEDRLDAPSLTPAQVESIFSEKAEPSTFEQRKMMTRPENAVYIEQLLTTHDMLVVQSAAQLRTYITNKLLIETNNGDAKVRIKALELLGKITDVGLFTEKSEVTVNNKATSELQNILRQKLDKMSSNEKAIDATYVDIPPIREVSLADELAPLIKSEDQ